MLAQEPLDQKQAESPEASPTDAQRPAESLDQTIPSAYDILMQQHRDSVLRIHALETENQNIMNLLKQTLSGSAFTFVDQAANPTELLARIQALEGRSGPDQVVSQSSPSAPTDHTEAPRVSSDEIEQLRVQNLTLVGQISKLDTQLQEIRSKRGRRRSKKHGFLQRLIGR
ncbi:MAG: hypothetical protein IIB17_12250 [Chloroflexi bacterium]|nr:hypothetical protein [Chloroflexota bacterium]